MSDLISSAVRADGAESWTRREILQQPQTLIETQRMLRDSSDRIERFIAPLLARPDLHIILTGAGTSAFIGECLAPWLSRATGRCVAAVATSDIVSSPDV